MAEIRETCSCGAIWEGPAVYREDRDKFRAAHTDCNPAPSQVEGGDEEDWPEDATTHAETAIEELEAEAEEKDERISEQLRKRGRAETALEELAAEFEIRGKVEEGARDGYRARDRGALADCAGAAAKAHFRDASSCREKAAKLKGGSGGE